jgi:hypothetical protein
MFDRRWSILVVLFLARTAMGFQFQSISSVSSFLITDLHIGCSVAVRRRFDGLSCSIGRSLSNARSSG